MKKIVQVGLDVTPSAGGSTAALHWIRDALGGEAISFTGFPVKSNKVNTISRAWEMDSELSEV